MKNNILHLGAVSMILFVISCRERCDNGSNDTHQSHEIESKAANFKLEAPTATPTVDPTYGELDAEGFPVDPGLAMNSNKMSKEQRMELRQQPPPGYHVGEPLHPRFISGKTNDISWRDAQDDNLQPGNKEAIAELLGLSPEHLPSGIFGDYFVLRSPSKKRVIVHSGSNNSAFLFTAESKGEKVSSATKFHCINVDDKRRGFIRWKSFVSESVIVGILSDDGDLENFPSRQIIYTYNINSTTLRRLIFPNDFLEKYGDLFIIDSVAPSAVLIKWDRGQQLMTAYLNQQ